MKKFFTELAEELEDVKEELWTETVLEGEKQGEKRLLKPGQRPKGQATDLNQNREESCSAKEIQELVSGLGTDENGTKVFRERVGRPSKLIICGAGHVSIPIIRMGKMLGYQVSVVEDRPKFADHARAAQADHVYCEPFEEGLAKIKGDGDSWFVIVTRGHRYDTDCLRAILKKPHAYIGMMGSKRRTAIVKKQLIEEGADSELVESVHTPIGLKIGAETPEEIAVSIMAEMIQIKHARVKSGGYSEELLEALLQEEDERQKVIATIISRKGSAPRGVGTKMLIFEDGTAIDTIGGGCIESDVMQKALLMMRTGTPKFQVCRVDMTADAAEDEGMVCGGVVEVMLECV